jgi:hypothetical protein
MKDNISLKALLLLAISLFSLNLFAQVSEPEVKTETHILTERYPIRAIERPGVMPTGIIGVDTNVNLTGFKTVGISIGSKFGIVNHLEGQFSYDGVKFNKIIDETTKKRKAFVPERTINLGLKYNYLSIPNVSLSASLNAPFHILDEGEIFRDLTIGLPAVFYNDMMAGGVLGDLFTVTMRPNVELEFNFKYWYGVQVYGNWWAEISSSFGSLKLKNPANQAQITTAWLWQKLPVELSALYAFNHCMDLAGSFGFGDALKPGDSIKFGLTFSFRGGRLFG